MRVLVLLKSPKTVLFLLLLMLLLQPVINHCEASVTEAPHNPAASVVAACYHGEAFVFAEVPQNRAVSLVADATVANCQQPL